MPAEILLVKAGSTTPPADPASPRLSSVNVASALFVAVALLLGTLLIAAVLIVIGRRLRAVPRVSRAEPTVDPWREAARRIQVDEGDGLTDDAER